MSASPLDPMMHMLTSLALTIGAAALVTVSAVMFLRWLGLHWTWTLPGVLLGPLLWPFDQGAAGFAVATSVFATATGARWHADDLRHGSDRAQEARDRRTPLDAARERIERRGVRGGGGSIAKGWRSGATSAGAPSASPSDTPAAGTPSSSARPDPARPSPRRGSPAASFALGTARS
jgi:hypothetical protein